MGSEDEEIGQYAWTSSELGNRIEGLDRAIQSLAVTVATTPDNDRGINDGWRQAFDAFLRRWQVERDAAKSWDARFFALPKINDFQRSYELWSADFRRKSGVSAAIPERDDSGAVYWLMAGALGALVAVVAVGVMARR
jgi:hypothetical protein